MRDDRQLPDAEGRPRRDLAAGQRRIGRIEALETRHVAMMIGDRLPRLVGAAPDDRQQEMEIRAAAVEDDEAQIAGLEHLPDLRLQPVARDSASGGGTGSPVFSRW